ncbi:M64 family metallopeptidase [Pseudoduganella namucuonensis]|uniref:DUF4214 domain-containing protein n=1 Tax=Pseudoduganella namucuonensis TaxID=1035707 RepID=A0A1I7I5F1_9BURK|nr:M64 family metallopeptidase [Pseudoduganella namucuonensis]SFU68190.1 protein of unknown function [Pseudoduganella namucuonensis]
MADVTSIISTGASSARVDITFVAEGYLASERDKFLADAAKFAEYIFDTGNAALNSPFSNYKNYFNTNALFVASNQSRWDVTSGVADTYFKANSYLDDGRLVYGDTTKVYETVGAALPGDAQDITIVLINSKAYGGAGGPVSWATTGNLSSAEVLLHELGHSVADLGDEYLDSALGATPLTEPLNLANVTTAKAAPPWQAWLGYEDELGKVGLYEGGYYRATGVWRATQDSKMLSLGKAFNAPAKEAFALAFYGKIADYLALNTAIPGLCFADVPDRASLSYTWSQNGAALANGGTYCLDIYGGGKYSAGATVTLTTVDATGLIRTGLSQTQETETLAIQAGAVDMAGAALDITQGGGVFRFDGADNTITVRDGVTAAYFDGGNGADTVILNLALASVGLEKLASGTWLLSRADTPVMALRNVEFIQFSDKTQSLVETLTATGGNDKLQNHAASELIDGGAGTDSLAYAGARAGFSIEKSGAGYTITDLASGSADIVSNVERLGFSDAAIALDIAGVGGQAYRLYQAAFNRAPDSAGLGYWISVMDQGASLREVSAGFTASAEFKTVYGVSPSNAQIIDKLYQNILHRAGEAAGVAYWLEVLDKKQDTLAGVLANFSEGAENQGALAGLIGNGFAYTPYG